MMTDLDVAVLLIKTAFTVEACAVEILDEAMRLAPDLPWRLAARGLAENDDSYSAAMAFVEAATVGHPI